jgi:hypothetical protein
MRATRIELAIAPALTSRSQSAAPAGPLTEGEETVRGVAHPARSDGWAALRQDAPRMDQSVNKGPEDKAARVARRSITVPRNTEIESMLHFIAKRCAPPLYPLPSPLGGEGRASVSETGVRGGRAAKRRNHVAFDCIRLQIQTHRTRNALAPPRSPTAAHVAPIPQRGEGLRVLQFAPERSLLEVT